MSQINCKTCGHILGHSLDFKKTGLYNSVCHCGCTDWIPLDNLQYLEWCYDQKRTRELTHG